MADSIALPRLRPISPQLHLFKMLPWITLLAAIGYAGRRF